MMEIQRVNMVKAIIAGGRACRGVDLDGETWAKSEGIPVQQFIADWRTHGKSAGPIRNSEMINYLNIGDIVIVFPGGNGTDDLKRKAKKKQIAIIEWIHHPIIHDDDIPF